jgi:hypothetical protein
VAPEPSPKTLEVGLAVGGQADELAVKEQPPTTQDFADFAQLLELARAVPPRTRVHNHALALDA